MGEFKVVVTGILNNPATDKVLCAAKLLNLGAGKLLCLPALTAADSPLEPSDTRQLCLFKAASGGGADDRNWSEAVTRGVKIEASGLFTPERSDVKMNVATYAYQISMSLTEKTSPDVAMVQLDSRHWRIKDVFSGHEDDVQGSGVIGEYPLLEVDGTPFKYCSNMSTQVNVGGKPSEATARMGGSFKFVQGSLADQVGDPFEAIVGDFELFVPDFVY